jgi:hypothetical protein
MEDGAVLVVPLVLKQIAYSGKVPMTFVMSDRRTVCLCVRLVACISAAPTRRMSVKFGIGNFYENLSRKYVFG